MKLQRALPLLLTLLLGERLKIRENKLLETVLKQQQKVQAGPADNQIPYWTTVVGRFQVSR